MEVYLATIEDLEGVSNLFNLYRTFYEQISDVEAAKYYLTERLEMETRNICCQKQYRYVVFT